MSGTNGDWATVAGCDIETVENLSKFISFVSLRKDLHIFIQKSCSFKIYITVVRVFNEV